MKVKELKLALQKVPDSAEVYIEMPNDECTELNYYDLTEVEFKMMENCIHLSPCGGYEEENE